MKASSKMKIRLYGSDNTDSEKINSFLLDQDNNSVFQSVALYKVFTKVNKHEPLFLIAEDDNGKIKGLLLSLIIKEYNGVIGFFSARSIILGGPIFKTNDLKTLELLLKTYNKKVSGKAIYSQFRNLREFSGAEKGVFRENGFKYEPHLDIIHDLTKSIEEQWANVHKGRRKNINRSERAGLIFREVQNEEEYERALKLVHDTYKRVKLPMPDKSIFIHAYQELLPKGILKVFIALDQDKIIGTRLVLCYDSLIYDWYAGADANHMNKYPNDFLPWKIMEWGHRNSYKYFDFGGAGKPDVPYGVRDHKLKFGGKLVEYGRFEKAHFPIIFNSISFMFNLYRKIAK